MPVRTSHCPGFTLIEMLMVVCLIAVLAALGAPAYGGLIGRTLAGTAESALQATLNDARTAAISRHVAVIACPSDDLETCDHSTHWHQGWLVFADLDHDGERSADEPLLEVASAQPAGVAIVSTNGRPRVVYKPDGRADGSNLTITVCDRIAGAAAANSLVVNMAGRVRSTPADTASANRCLQAAG